MKTNRQKRHKANVNARQRNSGTRRGRARRNLQPITALIVPAQPGRCKPVPAGRSPEIVPRNGDRRVGTVLSEITWEYVAYRYLGLGIHEVPVEGKNVLRLSTPRSFNSERTGIRDLLALDLSFVYRRPGCLGLLHTHLLPQYFASLREWGLRKGGMSEEMFEFTYVRSARRAEFDTNHRLIIGASLSPVLGCSKIMKVTISPCQAILEIVGPSAPEAAAVAAALNPAPTVAHPALPPCTVAQATRVSV